MDADELAEMIRDIRKGIGHGDSDIRIVDVIFNEKKDSLLIVAPDRSDKSAIIGKGGWVVGKLREKLGVGRVHVEAETDIIIRRHRVGLALERISELEGSFRALKILEEPLKMRLEYPSDLELILDLVKPYSDGPEVAVALSGGVDSSFSLIAAVKLGLKAVALTVDPGTIILPGHLRRSVEELSGLLGVRHEYIEAELGDIQIGALDGRFHPCGRCSGLIENAVMDKIKDMGIDTVIFGDLLSTGYQSVNVDDGILRVNMPALFAASKQEVRSVASAHGVRSSMRFGCPLVGEVHRRHPHLRRYSIQRVLRETRAGVLEPGEALDLIWSI
ncbi:MAG: ATPase [Methanothermobacter sp.]|jgi:predicted PP-loop superfamily ATPase|nr:ATPase [Methanothermobacter thermautotrophicus]MCQ8904194.1 ATPase [Methanothermobacter sp.]